MNLIKKASLATALAATAFATASPAMARDYRHDRGDDTAAIAIGAGIIGLALGAIVASSDNDRHRDRYERRYDRRHQDYRRSGWQYRDGYYWDRDGYRYDRDGYRYDRYGRRYDNRRYDPRTGYYGY